ncbi:MAG: KaiB protein [Bacteroidota bacterium]|jgi:circadian clock protein KaiB|nr:KaiB protein [Bacteroidota bacterium]
MKKTTKTAAKTPKKMTAKSKSKDFPDEKYILQLFIAGILPNSLRAVENINSICEKYLKGRYELEIIDIHQQPDLALDSEIIAIPALIKKSPLPEERMIGDLSDTKSVLIGLRIKN